MKIIAPKNRYEMTINKILSFDRKISSKLIIPEDKNTARKIAGIFAHSGDSWYWLIALFIIWLLSKGSLHTQAALFAGAITLQAFSVLILKSMIKRKRPQGEWGAIYRNIDPHSFPSGHAVRAVMIAALAWGWNLQPLAWFLIFWAPCVGLARIMLGVHYLSDVVAGWALGLLLAWAYLSAQPLLVQYFGFVLFN